MTAMMTREVNTSRQKIESRTAISLQSLSDQVEASHGVGKTIRHFISSLKRNRVRYISWKCFDGTIHEQGASGRLLAASVNLRTAAAGETTAGATQRDGHEKA
jgi:hypothetical protein